MKSVENKSKKGLYLLGKGCYNVRSVVAVYVFTLLQSYLRQIVVLNFISFNEREKFMNSEQLKNSNKVKLSKEQQLRMLEFFVKTSIPRILQSSKEQK